MPDRTTVPFLLGAGVFVSPMVPGSVWRRSPACSTCIVTGEKGLSSCPAPTSLLGWGSSLWWGRVDTLHMGSLSQVLLLPNPEP